MKWTVLPLGSLVAISLAAGVSNVARSSWPNGPFQTTGRWIADANDANVTYAGVNWPAHGEAMIPEGLQYQSIQSIVSKIKSLGMNAIRLTYAIEMVDQIVENGGSDIRIEDAFTNALGPQNGTTVYGEVIAKNPSFRPNTTRLQVFSGDSSNLRCRVNNLG